MNFERLSGLLLGIVALATVAYLAKEIIAMRMTRPLRVGDLAEACKRAARAVAAHAGADAKPVNDHLIGEHGKVVAHAADEARPMRVRVGIERWAARSSTPDQGPIPIDAPIEVTAVEGSILIVEARILSSDNAEEGERV
jgi:membrane protein implicated in regulation of membrane protease activity